MNPRLAGHLGTDPAVYEWVEAVLLFQQVHKGYVTGAALTEGTRALSAATAERVVMELAAEGSLQMVKRQPQGGYLKDRYQMVSSDQLRSVLRAARQAALLLQQVQANQPEADTFSLVATLPAAIAVGVHGVRPMSTTLQMLVVGARQSVTVLNPFFDQDGLDPLAEALLARARHGVNVTFIVREVRDPKYVNHQVLKRFAMRVLEEGLEDRFTMYEFERREAGKVTMTFHAKAIIVDEREAYLGSANLTSYGMGRYVELGTLLRGPSISKLTAVVRALVEAEEATAVSLQSLATD